MALPSFGDELDLKVVVPDTKRDESPIIDIAPSLASEKVQLMSDTMLEEPI